MLVVFFPIFLFFFCFLVLVTRNCFLCIMSNFVSIKIQSFFVVKFLKNIYFFSVMQSQKFIEKIFLFL